MNKDLLDYILYYIYQRSESVEKMKYTSLFDLIEGKHQPVTAQAQLSVNSEAPSRKRPESSSPEKLKARNKDKFNKLNEAEAQ